MYIYTMSNYGRNILFSLNIFCLYSYKRTFLYLQLEEDAENYRYFKTMENTRLRLKPDVIPHIFACQKCTSTTSEPTAPDRKAFLKRQHQSLLNDTLSENEKKIRLEEQSLSLPPDILEETQITRNVGTQVDIKPSHRSKYIQCNILKPTEYKQKKITKNAEEMVSSSSGSWTSTPSKLSVSSYVCSSNPSDSSFNSFKRDFEKMTFYLIEKSPKLYIGIPSESIFLVEILCSTCNLTKQEVYVTLKKIKCDLPYSVLADDFNISTASVCSIIQKCIPKIASQMKSFIKWRKLEETKIALPIPFRYRYKMVQIIIDCFEISIQKPSNPIWQSLTWSDYKKSNTIKYLIGCTPDGLVSFVSEGYGGRATDKVIVEDSQFVNLLDDGAHVMADRGFKNIDHLLHQHNNKLVRPPSVSAGIKKTKEEVKESKRIASLRIHVERVISRIREFKILKPHSNLNLNLIKYLDMIVVIVCGLINIQNCLIKNML